MLNLLGKGAFGVVWRAELLGEGGFQKEVAVKVLHRGVEDVAIARRLRDEARILGLIRHPGVVQVDGLVKVGGRWAVVMELIEGADLSQLLARGRFPTRVALEITGEVARVLAAAWDTRGPDGQPLRLVHRDIKPSNLKLTPTGSVKVLDFGVARAEFHGRESQTSETSFGTLLYMSPERLEWVDGPEGDVYALGAVLFEMLVGEPLGRTHVRSERHAALLAGAVERLRPHLPRPDPGVEALVLSLLAFEPSSRPAPKEIEDRCESLADAIGGDKLRRWAAATVPAHAPPPPPEGADDRFDVDIHEFGSDTPVSSLDVAERASEPASLAPAAATPLAGARNTRSRWAWVLSVLLLVLIAVAATLQFRQSGKVGEPAVPLGVVVPVTLNDPVNNPIRAFSLAPDGSELVYATLYGTWRRQLKGETAAAEQPITVEGRPSQGGWYRSDGRLLIYVKRELWLEEGQEFRHVGDILATFLEPLPDDRIVWWGSDAIYVGTLDRLGTLVYRTISPMAVADVQASPDGRFLAIKEKDDKQIRLTLVAVDGSDTRSVVADPRLRNYAWLGPDRLTYVLYQENGPRLYTLDLGSGRSRAVCDLPRRGPFGAYNLRWDASTKTLYFLQGERQWQYLWTGYLNEAGELADVRPMSLGDAADRNPLWLDERRVVFVSSRGGRDALYQQDIDGSGATLYADDPEADLYDPFQAPGGLLAWRREPGTAAGALVRVNPPHGPHEVLAQGTEAPTPSMLACTSAALACACFQYAGDRLRLGWLAPDGRCADQGNGPVLQGPLYGAALSRDRARLLLMDSAGTWAYQIASGVQGPIETGLPNLMSAAWAADGRSAFVSGWSSDFAGVIHRVFPDGRAPVQLHRSAGTLYDLAVSPDGGRLVWRELPLGSRVVRLVEPGLE